jgi:hypothetical protein
MPVPPFSRPGPYDSVPDGEEDLWFLPAPEPATDLSPLPRSNGATLIDPREWQAAQSDCTLELAALSYRFGLLSERLRNASPGRIHRLALAEATEIGWWSGDRITAERLSLWLGLHQSMTQEETTALQRAGWAVRRLSGGPGPAADGWADGLRAFLDRPMAEVADLADLLGHSAALHPAVQAALLFQAWRMTGAGGPATGIEAAVLAARTGALMGQGAPFLPLAGGPALRATGLVRDRLFTWLTGADTATRAALTLLDRLALWENKARTALTDLSGRTPPALITAFADWPHLTAPMAEGLTGASRAAVQRNFVTMTDRALIREVTGQGRFRVWTARF